MGRLRTWYAEYTGSLKAVEMEEALDLVVYRPLAFLLTKLVYPTPITPNQISVVSLVFGLLAGYFFWLGNPSSGVLAAGAYFLCNVLDCADGQLARLRGKPSPFGYIVDGSIDYLASVAVFVGMSHGLVLQRPTEQNWWVIGTIAGVCYAWQCAILDRKRHEWAFHVYDRRRDTEAEIAFFKEHLERYRRDGNHHFDRLLIWIYFTYMGIWTRLTPKEAANGAGANARLPPDSSPWAEYNRPVLRMALLMGPTTQMTLIMLAGITNRADLYLYGTLLVGNSYALVVLAAQWNANHKLARVVEER
jgi:hypothetical protein